MNIHFFTHKENKPAEDDREEVNPYPHESNIADGGEFMDDGIRSKDQPLSETSLKNEAE